MKIKEIMRRFPKTVNVDDTLEFARDIMVWMELRHLPVLRDGKLIGLLTERDLAAYQAVVGEREGNASRDRVEAAMQPDPHTVHPDDPVVEAAGRMSTHKIGCLPVIEKGELIGMITTTDILAAQVSEAMGPAERLAGRPAGPTVGEVMTADPLAVHPDDYLINAAVRMQQNGIRHLPVVDGARDVVGMLSDRDVRAAIGDPTRAADSDTDGPAHRMRVRNAMTENPITASPEQSCAELARLFVRQRGSAVPVVDGEGKLVGILSYIDILRGLADVVDGPRLS